MSYYYEDEMSEVVPYYQKKNKTSEFHQKKELSNGDKRLT